MLTILFFKYSEVVISCHVVCNYSLNSSNEFIDILFILLCRSAQAFSIGDKSGDMAGQGVRTSMPQFPRYVFVDFAVWQEAPSY